MANDNTIGSFTAGDIEKYHKGQLSVKEMHALEKAALDDPFLADALEGYLMPGIDISADMAELEKRLASRTDTAKVIPLHTADPDRKRSFIWLRIAVMIVLIAGAGWLTYAFLFKTRSNDLAKLSQKEENSIAVAAKPKDSLANTNTITSSLSKPGQTDNLKEETTLHDGSSISTDKATADQNAPGDRDGMEEKHVIKRISADSGIIIPEVNKGVDLVITTTPSFKKEEYKLSELKAFPDNNVAKYKWDSTTDYAIGSRAKKQVAVNGYGDIAQQVQAEKPQAFGYSQNYNKKLEESYRNPNYFRGRVTDANNNALPFANITNSRDNVGTYSDANGYFALVSPDSIMNVQVKVVGFENKKLNLQNTVPTNMIVMQEDRSVATKVLDTVKRNYAARRSGDGTMTLEEPEPADGWSYYNSYVANNLNVPETFDTKRKDGDDAVEVSFEVNKNGEPINLKIEKSLCDKCDKEAIRLIKEGPKWKRKAKKGKRTTITVPFTKLD
jgi:hypothetical protein